MTGSAVHAPMRLGHFDLARYPAWDGEASHHFWPVLVFMKFRVVLDYDPATQSYSAVCLGLPGCASAGETEVEARQNIAEAIRLYLAE